jgi:hypothetical protein
LVATVTAEEAVGGGERQRRPGSSGGGGGRGAVVHVRARRRPTITDSPPPLVQEFSDSPPLGEETAAEKIDLGASLRLLELSLSFYLLRGKRLKNRQIIVLLTAATTRAMLLEK